MQIELQLCAKSSHDGCTIYLVIKAAAYFLYYSATLLPILHSNSCDERIPRLRESVSIDLGVSDSTNLTARNKILQPVIQSMQRVCFLGQVKAPPYEGNLRCGICDRSDFRSEEWILELRCRTSISDDKVTWLLFCAGK